MSNELRRDYENFLRKIIDVAKCVPFFTKRGIHDIEDSLEAFRKRHLSADLHKNKLMLFLIDAIYTQDADEITYIAYRLLRAESL